MNIYDKIRSGETINQQLEGCVLSMYRDNDFLVFKYDFRDHQPAFSYRMPLKKLDEIEARAKIGHWTIDAHQGATNAG